MLKKPNLLLIFIVGILFVTGCTTGSGTVINSTEWNSTTKMSMFYDSFTGYKQTHIEVTEASPVVVRVDIVTNNGSIEAYIAVDNDISKASYEGRDIPTSSFTVTLTQPGEYTLRVQAKNHSGGYSFSW